MKAIVQTANVEEEAISLQELIPFWFAVSQPAGRHTCGVIGSMVYYLAERVTTSRRGPDAFDKS